MYTDLQYCNGPTTECCCLEFSVLHTVYRAPLPCKVLVIEPLLKTILKVQQLSLLVKLKNSEVCADLYALTELRWKGSEVTLYF
jgi:hypothetical protein